MHIPSFLPDISFMDRHIMLRPIPRLVVPFLALVAACQPAADKTPAATKPVPAEAIAAIDTATLMRHIRVLADDSLMGRQPGTAGRGQDRRLPRVAVQGDRPQARQHRRHLHPEGPARRDHGEGNAPTLTFAKGGTTKALKWRDDYVAWTKHVAPSASLDKSELVFVGYGTEAPEFKWDDFKGMDVAGKTLVMLVNDPPLADTTQFGGKRMTYYGRWTYKYEQGMKHKAAGVLLVHETERAGYPFAVVQGKTAEQFDLVTPDKNMSRSNVEGWITLDQAKALFAMAGPELRFAQGARRHPRVQARAARRHRDA